MLATSRTASPVGMLRLVASDRGLRAILWPDEPPGRVPVGATNHQPTNQILLTAADQLAEYFQGTRDVFSVPLDPIGTRFQLAVWRRLSAIPYGQTVTYGELARSSGRPTAARAVGAANGRNPLSIAVPCHRVVGARGGLVGFAGGLAAKRWLLDHEAAHRSAHHTT